MQNMKKVIEAIRVELAKYWDQCFYSQEQRQAFAAYYDGQCRSAGLIFTYTCEEVQVFARKFPLLSR